MKFLILVIVLKFFFSHKVTSTSSEIEENCKFCTLNQSRIFLKAIWQSNLQPSYSCRGSFGLASKYGIIVDHACRFDECNGISDRNFLQPYGAKNFNCRYKISCYIKNSTNISRLYIFNRQSLFWNSQSLDYHRDVRIIIKDYIEIFLMGCILAMLLLKKKLLKACIVKRLRANEHRNGPQTHSNGLDEV